MPYPAGMTHALAIVTSGVVHMPSIGSEPPEVCGAYLLPRVLPHAFYHSEAFRVGEHPSQRLSIDVLIGVEADDQSISRCLPSF